LKYFKNILDLSSRQPYMHENAKKWFFLIWTHFVRLCHIYVLSSHYIFLFFFLFYLSMNKLKPLLLGKICLPDRLAKGHLWTVKVKCVDPYRQHNKRFLICNILSFIKIIFMHITYLKSIYYDNAMHIYSSMIYMPLQLLFIINELLIHIYYKHAIITFLSLHATYTSNWLLLICYILFCK
jgi:hypothetical protein